MCLWCIRRGMLRQTLVKPIGIIGGVERKIHFFAFDLPHSDACFVVGYPAETTEAFCDGHVRAFAFFGGVPKSILYDNTKIAVARILGDGKLPASDDKKVKHVTKDPVDVSALAYFENEGTGLDAVRRSRPRAMELLLFLANHVLEAEPDSLEPLTAECECGQEHHYYPCHWLIPMFDRKWVPLGENKQAFATAESIAQLFEGEEEQLAELTAGKGRLVLEALGISMADLTL